VTTLELAFVRNDPQILGDTIVFAGTRVPLRLLFDQLQGGRTIDEFVSDHPTVSRQQALAVLQLARDVLIDGARLAAPGTIKSVDDADAMAHAPAVHPPDRGDALRANGAAAS
jgi:uncharacterized protein (DUF433 family)